MFAQLYRDTTDPDLSWYDYFMGGVQGRILASIVFHAILYTAACNLAWWLLKRKRFPANARLVAILLVVMYLGYMARLLHVQNIYQAFPRAEARAFTDQHYNAWIFLG